MAVDRQILLENFSTALAVLDSHFAANPRRLDDENADALLRKWLDDRSAPLEWAAEKVTADEWFLITTLFRTMDRAGQRTHIRKYFPLFVSRVDRDIRNVTAEIVSDWKLRSPWMKTRLVRMANVLRERETSMADYSEYLRGLEPSATPENPSPALTAIKRDLHATELKTLSVFVRDCVHGNCFPIDTRVANELRKHGLPHSGTDETLLVRLCLSLSRNPRQVARMFYEAGGKGEDFS